MGQEDRPMDKTVILRRWSARIRTADEAYYVAYIAGTGLDDYRATPGNLGAQMLVRTLGNGESEVTTLSWWESIDAISAFAGEDIDRARYYPEDDRFLLTRPDYVEHHRVVGGADLVERENPHPQGVGA
jgi:heme-degrading monooxygenase HmoA